MIYSIRSYQNPVEETLSASSGDNDDDDYANNDDSSNDDLFQPTVQPVNPLSDIDEASQ